MFRKFLNPRNRLSFIVCKFYTKISWIIFDIVDQYNGKTGVCPYFI